MVWDAGFEPTALGAQGRCSTAELIPEKGAPEILGNSGAREPLMEVSGLKKTDYPIELHACNIYQPKFAALLLLQPLIAWRGYGTSFERGSQIVN